MKTTLFTVSAAGPSMWQSARWRIDSGKRMEKREAHRDC
jgi:hypothetical protein